MILTKEQKEGQELFQNLIAQAWESATFKEQLINNPEATIAQFTGKELKSENDRGAKIVVEDQTNSNTIYLNIPRKIELDELSEEQLEMVAGGTHPKEGHSPNLVYEVFYHATTTIIGWFK